MITVLASAKGGSGKTSLATALASESARGGMRTLLIDADTQANSSQWLMGGASVLDTTGDGGRGLYRLFIDGDTPTPLKARPQLDLLPAGRRTQSLADELGRMLTTQPADRIAGLRLVRELLHDETSSYDQVWIDTPPSLQSPALTDTFLAAADFVLVPFKASTDHARAAFHVIEQLLQLDELGVDHARAIGVVVFDRDASATRLEAAVHEELERIAALVPIFENSVIHRAAPAAAALRHHLTPHELVDAVPDKRTRLAALRKPKGERGSDADVPHVRREVAEKYAANYANVFQEFMRLARAGVGRE